MRTALKLRPLPALAACFAMTACASRSHITAFQEAPIPPASRTLALALDNGEKLPFDLSSDAVAAIATRAGFTMQDANPRYRLALTAAAASSDTGSYLPGEDAKARPHWIARPDRSLRARFAKGHVLRVTAVLFDASVNREVWRGTGTLRTADPRAAAHELVEEVLAKLPKE